MRSVDAESPGVAFTEAEDALRLLPTAPNVGIAVRLDPEDVNSAPTPPVVGTTLSDELNPATPPATAVGFTDSVAEISPYRFADEAIGGEGCNAATPSAVKRPCALTAGVTVPLEAVTAVRVAALAVAGAGERLAVSTRNACAELEIDGGADRSTLRPEESTPEIARAMPCHAPDVWSVSDRVVLLTALKAASAGLPGAKPL